MMSYGEASGVAADLEIRERLDRKAANRTAADHAIESLAIIAGHAGRWLAGNSAQSDPTAAMRTIRRIAEDGAARVMAMQKERH